MKMTTSIMLLTSLLLLVSSIAMNAKKSSSSTDTNRKRLQSQSKTKIEKRNKAKFPYGDVKTLVDGKRGSVLALLNVPKVTCFDANGPLTKLHIYGEDGWVSNSIGYEWDCMANLIEKGQNVHFFTSESINQVNYVGAGESPKILNNVAADCFAGFISSFSLVKTSLKLYYTASCLLLKQKACETKTTKDVSISWKGYFSDTVSYLDKIPIEAPQNKALTSFKLVKKGENVAFEYRVCEVDTSAVEIEKSAVSVSKIHEPKFNVDNLKFNLAERR